MTKNDSYGKSLDIALENLTGFVVKSNATRNAAVKQDHDMNGWKKPGSHDQYSEVVKDSNRDQPDSLK